MSLNQKKEQGNEELKKQKISSYIELNSISDKIKNLEITILF